MGREHGKITIKGLYINSHVGDALGAVDNGYGTHPMSLCYELLGRKCNSQDIAHLGKGNDFCLCCYLLFQFNIIKTPLPVTVEIDQGGSCPLAALLPRNKVAMMFAYGNDHLVSWLEDLTSIAKCQQVQSLGGIA